SAIATHEIGHALGLAHNTADPAIMNPVMSVNELQPPDIAGIEAIYGASQVASAAAPPTQATHLAAAAHADPLIALPPAGDPTFAGTLDHDIEVLASRPANGSPSPFGRLRSRCRRPG